MSWMLRPALRSGCGGWAGCGGCAGCAGLGVLDGLGVLGVLAGCVGRVGAVGAWVRGWLGAVGVVVGDMVERMWALNTVIKSRCGGCGGCAGCAGLGALGALGAVGVLGVVAGLELGAGVRRVRWLRWVRKLGWLGWAAAMHLPRIRARVQRGTDSKDVGSASAAPTTTSFRRKAFSALLTRERRRGAWLVTPTTATRALALACHAEGCARICAGAGAHATKV
ncbi:hypothetical protein CYMTET_30078 [Cymbomonas tetramitiformis]|uniref:Uncharacterized protein n=1 Tax=Cymbomonas tetramitiformis TaxID=36881 RepID=A0AAE0FJU7_9CHLO|nr:hypothetical protein CYMTET_30078 [Cymbomonas tetramitiformis]